jgi:hypothetical protein
MEGIKVADLRPGDVLYRAWHDPAPCIQRVVVVRLRGSGSVRLRGENDYEWWSSAESMAKLGLASTPEGAARAELHLALLVVRELEDRMDTARAVLADAEALLASTLATAESAR